jgi:hypothetical protein
MTSIPCNVSSLDELNIENGVLDELRQSNRKPNRELLKIFTR